MSDNDSLVMVIVKQALPWQGRSMPAGHVLQMPISVADALSDFVSVENVTINQRVVTQGGIRRISGTAKRN